MIFLAMMFFLLLNGLLGACVWSMIDDDSGTLFTWYSRHTELAQFALLQLWPVAVWRKRRGRKG